MVSRNYSLRTYTKDEKKSFLICALGLFVNFSGVHATAPPATWSCVLLSC